MRKFIINFAILVFISLCFNVIAFARTKTNIIASLGPATSSVDVLENLINAGMNMARVNFSHGTHDSNAKIVSTVRKAAERTGKHVSLIVDLQGPKYRIGKFKNDRIELKQGQKFILDLKQKFGDEERVTFNHPELYPLLSSGYLLLIDDGAIVLKVTKVEEASLETEVTKGGDLSSNKKVHVKVAGEIDTVVEKGGGLSSNKGVNLPTLNAPVKVITEKDRKDVAFAVKNLSPDYFALSFVQTAKDIRDLRKIIGKNKIRIIAKIEKPQALDNLEEIAKEADMLMVARGDLGVEVGEEKVPVIQRRIIATAKKYNKPVVIATQMMTSMIKFHIPTRAEVSDVATSVYLGANSVMLSNETAVGAYPVETVQMMRKILDYTEKHKGKFKD